MLEGEHVAVGWVVQRMYNYVMKLNSNFIKIRYENGSKNEEN